MSDYEHPSTTVQFDEDARELHQILNAASTPPLNRWRTIPMVGSNRWRWRLGGGLAGILAPTAIGVVAAGAAVLASVAFKPPTTHPSPRVAIATASPHTTT